MMVGMDEQTQSEEKRKLLTQLINDGGVPATYDGPLWDTEELQRDFEVMAFLAPFVSVRRKADGQKGLLTFVHIPRVYFDFQVT